MTVFYTNVVNKLTTANPLFNLGVGDELVVAKSGIIIGGPGEPIHLSKNNLVQVDGQVYAFDQYAAFLQLSLDGPVDIRVSTTGVVGAADAALAIFGPSSHVWNAGLLQGDRAVLADTAQDLEVENSGQILGGAYALATGDRGVVVNSGEILGNALGIESLSLTLHNTGDITAADTAVRATGAKGSVIYNDGDIAGVTAIDLGSSGDKVVNAGTISGDVDLNDGNDKFDGRSGVQSGQISGGAGNDTLLGGDKGDDLFGDKSNDVLKGGKGEDTLNGGSGQDVLRGGADGDTFVFSVGGDSTAAAPDTIVDFHESDGDIIDLSGVDAAGLVNGNQAFFFIGTAEFSGAAALLRYEAVSNGVLVEGDVDGDKQADFAILLKGVDQLSADDFVL